MHDERYWEWGFPENSVLGSRIRRNGELNGFQREPRRLAPNQSQGPGWSEIPHLPVELSQRLAETLSEASYAVGELTVSLVDPSKKERSSLAITRPRRTRHHFAVQGGILTASFRDGLHRADIGSRTDGASAAQTASSRLIWDEQHHGIYDAHGIRRLFFHHTLSGNSNFDEAQCFVLEYQDDSMRWSVVVRREAVTDGYRAKPWLIDLRQGEAPRPSEADFNAMSDFIAVALLGWQDNEHTGPAPSRIHVFGGYVNGMWHDGLVVELNGTDTTRMSASSLLQDENLLLPTMRWTQQVGVRLEPLESPLEPPKNGVERTFSAFDEWLADNPHGTVARREDGGALLALLGCHTTGGHGGGTTCFWHYQNRNLWLRLHTTRWSTLEDTPQSFGPMLDGDPSWEDALASGKLSPRLRLELRRARLSGLSSGSSADSRTLALDGAVLTSVEATYRVDAQPQPLICP